MTEVEERVFLPQQPKIYFWQDKLLFTFTFSALLINFFLWIFTFLKLKNLPEQIILHYNVLTGVNWIDAKIYLLVMPLVGMIIFLVNFLISGLVYNKNKKLLSCLLAISSLVSNLLLAIALIFIINL